MPAIAIMDAGCWHTVTVKTTTLHVCILISSSKLYAHAGTC